MKVSVNKAINDLVKLYVKTGNWQVERGGKHFKLVHKLGSPKLTIPFSPSDRRAELNFKRQLERLESL